MPRSPKVGKTALLSFAIRLAVIALFVFAVPVTPSFAQAPGHVRVKFVEAGLLVGGAPAMVAANISKITISISEDAVTQVGLTQLLLVIIGLIQRKIT